MNDTPFELRRDSLVLSTDRSRIDVDTTLAMLGSTHWGGSLARETLERAIANSVCFAVYEGTQQLAFARAVTDLATFAYLTDVVVSDDDRGQGLGSWMIEAVLAHPDFQALRRIALLTRDARALYERYGFVVHPGPSSYMEIKPPYRRPQG